MSIRVKSTRLAARIGTPSVSVVANRGSISGDVLQSQPVATVNDTATNSRIYIPFSYLPITIGAPTDTPREFDGFAPFRIDVTNGILYYFYSGTWNALAGGEITIPATAWLFEDGTPYLFEDGTYLELGGA